MDTISTPLKSETRFLNVVCLWRIGWFQQIIKLQVEAATDWNQGGFGERNSSSFLQILDGAQRDFRRLIQLKLRHAQRLTRFDQPINLRFVERYPTILPQNRWTIMDTIFFHNLLLTIIVNIVKNWAGGKEESWQVNKFACLQVSSEFTLQSLSDNINIRHSRAGGNPATYCYFWIPDQVRNDK